MPSPRTRPRGAVRSALVEAGVELARSGGPDAVVLREVTRKVGVVPNAAFPTLWVLAFGIFVAYSFDFLLKNLRSHFIDTAGRKADNIISARIFEQMLGMGSNKTWADYPLFVTLGVNRGQRFGPFREEDYANRLVMAVDRERGGLVMFENDLQAGTEVQLMRRSIDFDYVGHRSGELLSRLEGRRPFFALYIDCAGRAAAYCGTEREEAEEVQRIIGGRMPLLGMYSGVEIARVGQQIQPLDWTGVLCVFSE